MKAAMIAIALGAVALIARVILKGKKFDAFIKEVSKSVENIFP